MTFITSKTKALTLAGLIFLGANITNTKAQYSQKGWLPVTENEFNRLKISEDSIQNINLTKNKDSSRYTDNSKRGKKFTDTNGEKYFWVNPNPTGEVYGFDRGRELINQPKYQTKTNQEIKETKLTEEQQLEALVNDPEIKNLIKDFNSSFEVEYSYSYLGEDITDKSGRVWKKGDRSTHLRSFAEYRYPSEIILKNKRTQKEVLISKKVDDTNFKLEILLSQGVYSGEKGIKEGIKDLISWKVGEEMLTTIEEKKDFIRPYFTDSIPNAIKNLPKYRPLIIYKEEFNQMKSGTIELEYKKPTKPVDMNEQKLDKILKEEKQ